MNSGTTREDHDIEEIKGLPKKTYCKKAKKPGYKGSLIPSQVSIFVPRIFVESCK
jgi:hypothetical protein